MTPPVNSNVYFVLGSSRSSGWTPDPLFSRRYLERHAPGLDAVHLHFGFDHLTPGQLEEFLAVLAGHRVPLLYTLHDLRNPHHDDPRRHHEHLRLLLAAAAEVITLTDAAATACEQRYGRRPLVVPHPSTLPADWPARIVAGKGVPKELINGKVNNTFMDVPAVFLPVSNITKDNLGDVVTKGVWTWAEICKGIETTDVCKKNL